MREGQPTILRATDIYNPVVANWQKTGIFEACTECWINQSEAARIAAEAYNIPFLSRVDALNGPDHLGYLQDMGYVSNDGIHPSTLMAEYTDQLLSQMGYSPTILH